MLNKIAYYLRRALFPLTLLLSLLIALPAQATLYDYYTSQGGTLPSVSERAKTAGAFGLYPYTGTAAQNNALERLLRGYQAQDDGLVGFGVASDYDTTLAQSMTSNQIYLVVSSLLTRDGQTVSLTNLNASKVYLTIEPGGSKEEFVMCTGVSTTLNRFDGCTRGLSGIGTSTASVVANMRSHIAGSKVTMSNVHYVYNEYVDRDTAQTVGGVKTFTSIPLIPTTTPTDPRSAVSLALLASTTYSGVVDASTFLAGKVELPTDIEYLGGTATGDTGATLVPTNLQNFTYKAVHMSNVEPFGETTSIFNVLYTSSTGRYGVAKANNLSTIDSIAGIAYEAGNAGDFKRVYTAGSLIFGGPSVPLATSSLVYLSDTGFPTTTNSGTYRKVIGMSLYNNAWFFLPAVDTAVPSSTPNRVPLSNSLGSIANGWIDLYLYGSCSDGNVTSTGVLTLSRDAYYNNLFITSTGTINTNGYKIYVCSTISGTGTIANIGKNGGNGGNGAAATNGAAGIGAPALNSGTVFGAYAGSNGGTGTNAAGGNGVDGQASYDVYGVQGAAGGAGSGLGCANFGTGGGAGIKGAAGTLLQDLFSVYSMTQMRSGTAYSLAPASGSGGGGGGCGASSADYGGGGGGGAGAGGVVWIAARNYNFSGTIDVHGGTGGTGGNGYKAGGGTGAGAGGGGGAGSGGLVIIIYRALNAFGTFNLAPGTPGAGGNNSGGSKTGVDGSTAATGTLLTFPMY